MRTAGPKQFSEIFEGRKKKKKAEFSNLFLRIIVTDELKMTSGICIRESWKIGSINTEEAPNWFYDKKLNGSYF